MELLKPILNPWMSPLRKDQFLVLGDILGNPASTGRFIGVWTLPAGGGIVSTDSA